MSHHQHMQTESKSSLQPEGRHSWVVAAHRPGTEMSHMCGCIHKSLSEREGSCGGARFTQYCSCDTWTVSQEVLMSSSVRQCEKRFCALFVYAHNKVLKSSTRFCAWIRKIETFIRNWSWTSFWLFPTDTTESWGLTMCSAVEFIISPCAVSEVITYPMRGDAFTWNDTTIIFWVFRQLIYSAKYKCILVLVYSLG